MPVNSVPVQLAETEVTNDYRVIISVLIEEKPKFLVC